jgi:hypothetical protein
MVELFSRFLKDAFFGQRRFFDGICGTAERVAVNEQNLSSGAKSVTTVALRRG